MYTPPNNHISLGEGELKYKDFKFNLETSYHHS